MSMVVNKPEQKEFEIPADGLYQAVLADVVDLGDQPTQFGTKHRARFVYILSEVDSEGRPFRLFQQLNVSIHEKSGMYKVVRRLYGKEVPESIDLETLIGKQCQLDVQQNEGSEGRMYANVMSVLAPQKGQNVKIPADFVRAVDKDKDEKPAQKTAPKQAPNRSTAGQTTKTNTTRTAPKAESAGVDVEPQGNVEISDEDIPF